MAYFPLLMEIVAYTPDDFCFVCAQWLKYAPGQTTRHCSCVVFNANPYNELYDLHLDPYGDRLYYWTHCSSCGVEVPAKPRDSFTIDEYIYCEECLYQYVAVSCVTK